MSEFMFSGWVVAKMGDSWPTLAKDLYDLGMTHPLSPQFREGDDPAKMIQFLDDCQELGLKVIVMDCRSLHSRERVLDENHQSLVSVLSNDFDEADYRVRFGRSLEDFGSHPAVAGFFVDDEPYAEQADVIFGAARVQREMAPHLMPYMNMIPCWDEKQLKMPYGEFLDRAVREGHVKILSADCYSQMLPGDVGWNDYFRNLWELSQASVRHGIPFCMIVLAVAHYDYETMTSESLRWQISTSAAMGAKMISIFTLDAERIENYRDTAFNVFGERTRFFDIMSQEIRQFRAGAGAILADLQFVNGGFTGKTYGNLPSFQSDELIQSIKVNNHADSNLLVSAFTDEAGGRYRTIVNMDRTRSMEMKVTFAPGTKVQRRFIGGWGARYNMPGYEEDFMRIWLAPGQMELLREVREE